MVWNSSPRIEVVEIERAQANAITKTTAPGNADYSISISDDGRAAAGMPGLRIDSSQRALEEIVSSKMIDQPEKGDQSCHIETLSRLPRPLS